MRRLDLGRPASKRAWQDLIARAGNDPERVANDARTRRAFGKAVSPRQAVGIICQRVAREGDRALLHFLQRLDGLRTTPAGLRVPDRERQGAARRLPNSLRRSIQECAAHIRAYHSAQLPARTVSLRRRGVQLLERRYPLERVGLYVPGGRAPLISTVLMNALPAAIAGVKELVLATPPGPGGRINDALLYAAELAGVSEIYRLGGAAAVAALALGTETIRPVDKVVGPGNVFVTEAKRQLVGRVGIDSLAGPSEILIVADEHADPEWLAWDLLAQGEHGSGALAILMSPSSEMLGRVAAAAQALVRRQPGLAPAWTATVLAKVRDLAQAATLADAYAPEHLSLQVARPEVLLPRVRRAGAVFLGPATPQAMGDYTAGPNHVLPTGGTARWASPLSVRDFLRYTSVVRYDLESVRREGLAAMDVAAAEGLYAHAESIRVRAQTRGRRRGL
jgi:histidinol dehydrogenase